jgi:hypothetical protein
MSPPTISRDRAEDIPAAMTGVPRDTSPPFVSARELLQARRPRVFMDAVIVPSLASLKARGHFAKVPTVKAEPVEIPIKPEPLTEDDITKLNILRNNVCHILLSTYS